MYFHASMNGCAPERLLKLGTQVLLLALQPCHQWTLVLSNDESERQGDAHTAKEHLHNDNLGDPFEAVIPRSNQYI